jgi:hypothetical protein
LDLFEIVKYIGIIVIEYLHIDPPLNPRPMRAGRVHEMEGIRPPSSGAATYTQCDSSLSTYISANTTKRVLFIDKFIAEDITGNDDLHDVGRAFRAGHI